jgi:hypothetical protein
LSRVIFAFAIRTPSALVGFCLSPIDVLAFPAVGLMGNTGVGIIDARSIGCVLIGPVVDLFLGIVGNSFFQPNSFRRPRGEPLGTMLLRTGCPNEGFNHAGYVSNLDAAFLQATNSFLELSFPGFSQRLRGQA